MPDKSEKSKTAFDYHTHIMHESQQVISRSRRLLEATDGLVRPPYKGSNARTLRDDQEKADVGRAEDPSL